MKRITDTSTLVIGPNTSVRVLLERLSSGNEPFQIVLDNDGRVIGTITDGDVRRAILNGMALEDSVVSCLNTSPTIGKIGDETQNSRLLRRLKGLRPFLPLIDENQKLREVLVAEPKTSQSSVALIMAGGFGKRLGERTRNIPKPLLPVGGQPILEHIVSAIEAAGVGTIHVSVHYLADQIKTFFDARGSVAEILFIEEEAPLGTAGALSYLPSSSASGPILVVNGDLITDVNYSALHEFYVRHNLDAAVCVARYDIQLPYGVVRYDESGVFAGIDEKPQISNFVAAGIYYLGSEFLALVKPGERLDMPDLLMMGRNIGLKIGLFPIHEMWTDVGRPEDLAAADQAAREQTGAPVFGSESR
ncbi:MAG: sugar phosphate nucleotidyltransferase [Pseudomonadota bacterium]